MNSWEAVDLKEMIIGGDARGLGQLMTNSTSSFVNYLLDDEKNSPLLLASNSSNVDVLRLLLSHGASIDHQNSDGYTALHVAAMNGCVEATRLLLRHGANPLKEDNEGLTAVDWTEEEGHWECHQLLQDQLSWEPEADVEESICEAFVTMMLDTASSDHLLDMTPDLPNQSFSTTVTLDTTSSDHLLDMTPDSPNQSFSTTVMLDTASSDHDLDRTHDQSLSTTSSSKGHLNQDLNQATCAAQSQGHHSPTANRSKSTTSDSYTSPHTILPALLQLDNQQLYQHLLELGECPGPVTNSTRQAYLVYLSKIKSGIKLLGNTGIGGFKYELALCLRGAADVPDMTQEEVVIFAKFRAAGQPKSFFNYLLLSPCEPVCDFRGFVEAAFYIGKGKNSRSLQHLREAGGKSCKQSQKMVKIQEIWRAGRGVLSLHVFNNTSANEAFCREAAMIDCMGLAQLTNSVRGHYHGVMAGWTAAKRRKFGVYLLHKAYQSFVLDPPREIYRADVP